MSTLTISLEKVDFLPPTRVTDDTSVLTLKNLVFEPLLKWADGQVLPALFGRWTHGNDGREWRFVIRDGATFHDGKPCVSADIISFIDGILDAVDTFGMKWSYARYLADAEIIAEDDATIVVRNPQPIADILDIFSEFWSVCPARARRNGSWRPPNHRPTSGSRCWHQVRSMRRSISSVSREGWHSTRSSSGAGRSTPCR
jgi:ABC-type transport system substrate-binding protein